MTDVGNKKVNHIQTECYRLREIVKQLRRELQAAGRIHIYIVLFSIYSHQFRIQEFRIAVGST